jgi:A/G-specific adenine glycosylase
MFGVTEPIDTLLGKSELMKILNKQIDKKDPAEFNQAIMEFGSICCKPRNPLCSECQFQQKCYVFRHYHVGAENFPPLPIKKNKIAVKPRRLDYLVCIENDEIWIKKRRNKDIWQGLYDFPECRGVLHTPPQANSQKGVCNTPLPIWTTNHLLSHQKLSIFFWKTEKLPQKLKSSAQKIKISKFFEIGTPIPINKFATHYQLITKHVKKKSPNVKKI